MSGQDVEPFPAGLEPVELAKRCRAEPKRADKHDVSVLARAVLDFRERFREEMEMDERWSTQHGVDLGQFYGPEETREAMDELIEGLRDYMSFLGAFSDEQIVIRSWVMREED